MEMQEDWPWLRACFRIRLRGTFYTLVHNYIVKPLRVLCTVAPCAILSDVFASISSLVSISVCLTNQQACMLPIIISHGHVCIMVCVCKCFYIASVCLSVCLCPPNFPTHASWWATPCVWGLQYISLESLIWYVSTYSTCTCSPILA